MKIWKISILFLVCCCNDGEAPSKDAHYDKWFTTQQKIHGLFSLERDIQEKAYRIVVDPFTEDYPTTVMTYWQDGLKDYLVVNNIVGTKGYFTSEGKPCTEYEVENIENLIKCYGGKKMAKPYHLLIEKKVDGEFSRLFLNFDNNKSCILETYNFLKKAFPDFDILIPLKNLED